LEDTFGGGKDASETLALHGSESPNFFRLDRVGADWLPPPLPSKWDCKYHVVFIPKYRRKSLYAGLRLHLGEVFRSLAEQKESRVEEGHLMIDHVHMLISIPPKYAVAQVVVNEGKTTRLIVEMEK